MFENFVEFRKKLHLRLLKLEILDVHLFLSKTRKYTTFVPENEKFVLSHSWFSVSFTLSKKGGRQQNKPFFLDFVDLLSFALFFGLLLI